MFDYAVLDRPIVIHAPDWEAYRALRGTYFDLHGGAARARSRATRTRWSRRCARAPTARPPARARSARASARSTTAAPPSASCAACGSASASRPRRGRAGDAVTPAARARRRRRPQRHEPARPASSASSASTSRSPRCKADDTNPRGFGEPRWVVDFHTRLLRKRARDRQRLAARRLGARRRGRPRTPPSAPSCASGWRASSTSADARRRQGPAHGLVPAAVDALRGRRSACAPSFVTMLRHPAEIARRARASPTARGRRRPAAPPPGST